MTIAEAREFCKARVKRVPRAYAFLVILILGCAACLRTGYVVGRAEAGSSLADAVVHLPDSGIEAVVASRTGSVFYLPWCAGASRINAVNRVWFVTAAAARAAGYAPARNCDGL